MMISKMINADVVVENRLWNKKIKDPSNYIKKKIKKIFKFNLLKNLNEISIVDFDHTDVVRHPLVTKIVKAYDDFEDD